MKKIITFAVTCMFTAMNANAQVVENDFGSTAHPSSSSSSGIIDVKPSQSKDETNNSVSFDVRLPKGGWGMGATLI